MTLYESLLESDHATKLVHDELVEISKGSGFGDEPEANMPLRQTDGVELAGPALQRQDRR